RATGLLHPPHTLKDAVRRLRLTFIASLRVVLFQHRHLVIVRPVGGPHLEVRASISYRTRHSTRQRIRSIRTQMLNLALIRPSGGECLKIRFRQLAISGHNSLLRYEKAPAKETVRGPRKSVRGSGVLGGI